MVVLVDSTHEKLHTLTWYLTWIPNKTIFSGSYFLKSQLKDNLSIYIEFQGCHQLVDDL